MTDDPTPRQTREIVIETEVQGPPDEVWATLTDAEELKRWFPLDASVEPGVDGKVWLSWGPGVEGAAPIHIWEPGRRFGWTEDYGQDAQGRPVQVMVDFHVEAREGTTVVRLVQSGIDASSDWDEMYDALVDGWTYFLFNLAFYLAKHRGKPRGMVWRRVATDLGRDAIWERLFGGALITASAVAPGADYELPVAGGQRGEIVSSRGGHHFTGTLPGLDDSLLFIEVEGKHVGFWLSTYGTSDETVAALQEEWDDKLEGLLD